MKALKMKKIFMCLTILVVALIISVLAASLYGVLFTGSVANAESAASTQEESGLRIVLYSTPSVLNKDNAYQEFIVTVRIEGVKSVNGGLFGAAVRVVPENASSLDFIGFVENNEIPQSALIRGSQHEEGIDVLMEGQCSGITALTDDFDIGGFKFKLKQGAAIPNSISFNYSDKNSADFFGNKVNMASGSFSINVVDSGSPDEPEQGGSSGTIQPPIDNNGGSDSVANTDSQKDLSTGAIAGISVGGVSFIGIIITIILIVLKKKKRS